MEAPMTSDDKLAEKIERCCDAGKLQDLVDDRLPLAREDAVGALASLATMAGLQCDDGIADWLAAHPPLPCCDICVEKTRLVTVEVMPKHFRASHTAARKRGRYPHNGAERQRLCRPCADDLIAEEDPDHEGWAFVVPSTGDDAEAEAPDDGEAEDLDLEGLEIANLHGALNGLPPHARGEGV